MSGQCNKITPASSRESAFFIRKKKRTFERGAALKDRSPLFILCSVDVLAVPELIILVVEIAPVAGVLRIGRVDRRDGTRKLQRVERANQVFTDTDALISLREGVDPVCIADRYADAAV